MRAYQSGYTCNNLRGKLTVFQAGHALAAASEGVGVQHLGAFTLLLLPGAYVALDSGALAALRPWRTLRVSHTLHCVLLCAPDHVDTQHIRMTSKIGEHA